MQSKRKRGGTQQKLRSKLIYQHRCFSSMSHFFIGSSSYPPFDEFRDESFLQMMNSVSGETGFKSLTIQHLKTCSNSELNTFKKGSR